ncbi:recombinase family protein [Sphingobacterium siyangense]|uniref:DNA invertase Pin-like site-specific DNA recombinase n=1 Tax=Sphingobacterium siyangense TaxID=459529 RepID=A0A562MK36_9SPHI|nr:recombinase family protein [Sphingobacterium siyangense]TWI20297.1 DNA invertase Pin-like site-specific DNA recombinase [Sphingobacterium siyangense]
MNMRADAIADLYVRVSTDEQADKGYSQRNQEEMLQKYCMNHSIEVRNIIYEDHSAKSFNRPEWKKLLQNLKKHRKSVDLILFTKWDRFSRNAGDAYQMINQLRDLNVEPQAIEQPLDLSIPENKMMLAFYLAAPEVENDRRALNVFYGMRRAKKEGRYMGLAPLGYKNKIDDGGNKYITPKEPDTSILQWAFQQLSEGVYNTEQIWKKSKEKGLKCCKNTFWQVIRNPVYCGKIFIPAFKDEESYFVEGQHEGIISDDLFYRVQDILDGRGRKYRTKMETRDEFPLRGFVICPKCGRLLTGSKSKGRNRYYTYYHCFKGCSYRINTDKLFGFFQAELQRYVPKKETVEIYRKILEDTYLELTKDIQLAKKQTLSQLQDYENRMSHIRNLLATEKIEASDYHEIKGQYVGAIEQLNDKLVLLSNKVPEMDGLMQQDIKSLLLIDRVLANADSKDSRAIINLLFPEKLTFGDNGFALTKPNDLLKLSYQYNISL